MRAWTQNKCMIELVLTWEVWGTREPFGVMETFYILVYVVVTMGLHLFQTQWATQFKLVCFTVHELHLNNKEKKREKKRSWTWWGKGMRDRISWMETLLHPVLKAQALDLFIISVNVGQNGGWSDVGDKKVRAPVGSQGFKKSGCLDTRRPLVRE